MIDKEAVRTQKGDMRFIDSVWWTCTDPDTNRWISVGDPSTKEAVRNAALEDAAKVCDNHAQDIDTSGKEPQSWAVVRGAVLCTGDMIRALKFQPAQPSDTELLRDAITAILWLDRRVPQVYKDMSHIRDTVARLEAAMRAEREGS